MKSVEELYNEVLKSESLKKEAIEAIKNQKTKEFLESHGVTYNKEELINFFKGKINKDGKVDDKELKGVAGGSPCEPHRDDPEGYLSILINPKYLGIDAEN